MKELSVMFRHRCIWVHRCAY